MYFHDERVRTCLKPGYEVAAIIFDPCKELMFEKTKIDKEDSVFDPRAYSQSFQFIRSFRKNSNVFWTICHCTYEQTNFNACCYCSGTSCWKFLGEGFMQSDYSAVLDQHILEFSKFFTKNFILFLSKLLYSMSYAEF